MTQSDPTNENEIFNSILRQYTSEEIALRDDVLSSINNYCAELSEELWQYFSVQMLPSVLSLEWTPELQQEYLIYQRLLNTQGYQRAGKTIMLQLKEKLQEQHQGQKQ